MATVGCSIRVHELYTQYNEPSRILYRYMYSNTVRYRTYGIKVLEMIRDCISSPSNTDPVHAEFVMVRGETLTGGVVIQHTLEHGHALITPGTDYRCTLLLR